MIKPLEISQIPKALKLIDSHKNALSLKSWEDENSLRQELLKHQSIGYFEEGRLLSFVLFREVTSLINEISILVTGADSTGKGVMTQLLQSLQTKECWLEVSENNKPANSLYAKLGFVPTGKRKNYYSDGSAAINYTYKPSLSSDKQ